MQEITLVLTLDEVNHMLSILGKEPLKDINVLFSKVVSQAKGQVPTSTEVTTSKED